MKNVFILLLPLNFLLLFTIVYGYNSSKRQGFVWATSLLALWVFVTTEVLSAFNVLTFIGLLTAWLLLFFFLGFYIYVKKIPFNYGRFPQIDKTSAFFLLLFFIFLFLLFIIAILQAPNNWDSMTYHLAKVVHWIQHQNTNHYATHIGRQIALNPMAEYLILHTILLTGNDYFANLIQFWAMLGSVITASLVAQYLGASFRGQVLTSFFVAAMPILILEAISTQNDVVVSYFILATIWAFLRLKQQYKYIWAFLVGINMGLALLTKSTTYFYLAPFVFFILIGYVKGFSKPVLKAGVLIVILVLFTNILFFYRNFSFFHSFIPEPDAIASERHSVANESHHIKSLLSNVFRNFGFNLSTENANYNAVLLKNIEGAHRLLSVDINDKKTSFSNFEMPFHNKFYSHDYAPNPVHTWAFFLLLPILYIFRERFSKEYFLNFILGISGFLLLIFMLKWQPFGTRFQIPFFMMVSIWVATAIDILVLQKKSLIVNISYTFLMILSLWNAIYYVYNSSNLALKGEKNIFNTEREYLYFVFRPELYQPYKNLVEEIKQSKCGKIHLKLELDDWEYPLWRMLANRNIDFEIYHTKVKNLTRTLENKKFKACGMVEINNAKKLATFKKY